MPGRDRPAGRPRGATRQSKILNKSVIFWNRPAPIDAPRRVCAEGWRPRRSPGGVGRRMYHVGKDGWLFLTGGTNAVAAQYGPGGRIDALLRRWRTLIHAR